MKIGLLQCDHVMPELRAEFGDFSDFFINLFKTHAPEISLDIFDVIDGEYPSDENSYTGFIGTGSRYSVYDDAPWIHRFKAYVRALYRKKIKFIGICFGHQMIAEALGGKSQASEKGWGLGVKKIGVYETRPWMDPATDSLSLLYSHMDQVIAPPPGSRVIAGNDHCPHAMISMGDHFMGMQAHPEFTPAYLEKLMQMRVERIGEESVESARKTLIQSTDEAIAARWMANFFHQP